MASDYSQTDCASNTVTPLGVTFGKEDMYQEDPECRKEFALNRGRFWFGFFELTEPEYRLAADGVAYLGLNQDLPLSDAYRGN